MVADTHPRLSADDREELSDLRLLLTAAEGNVRAALMGDELAQALVNTEGQVEQALRTVRRLRGKFAPDRAGSVEGTP